MTDNPFADAFETPAQHNQPVFSVSELSGALKRTVEDAFSLVRVRGEISGFKRAASGHLYLALKDENAVMDAVCWKGVAAKIDLKPQDGMEVVCKGRLTTYPGRSKYQLVIESMELAGEGALLKLLEDLKRKLAAEGLFDESRKKPLPFLPKTIGIVTSPTGAVIRDIMHRLNDRFPRHVLLWPCLVQGKGAAEQVAKAIKGFNEIDGTGDVPRPDLIIVARGGGSLEDLWSFNEEAVVRAAAYSDIPLISAVGHETDTTLIDYASDRRAPTPTAAAEIAVPVRRDLYAQVLDDGARLEAAINRSLEERKIRVTSAARAIPNPQRMVEDMTLRLDDRVERLGNSAQNLLQRHGMRVEQLASKIPQPQQQIQNAQERLLGRTQALMSSYQSFLQKRQSRYDRTSALVRRKAIDDQVERSSQKLGSLSALLESYSYKSVLDRGFALVSDKDGKAVTASAGLCSGDELSIQFGGDDQVDVLVNGEGVAPTAPPTPKPAPAPAPKVKEKPKTKAKTPSPEQGSLF
ncbi:Exodeoxyribonuclease 7 large subunit [Candidatus Terasakiella magnetica]|uniref:Exodeoxyribonuclease 7 large subunit n=1 Tax=Candidatus Terasakiella magnetica TaxID=1867952 RepID=A0A1C3RF17_9PROT|nr:exodeoxyribonuclease VII large subunit [Candidatus Terasakiella magnetica]SCA55851.1 Exodeoxyribonuclease 7 large subunit [Candidatus Terasakiella magnetica]